MMPMFALKSPDMYPGVFAAAFYRALMRIRREPQTSEFVEDVHMLIGLEAVKEKGKSVERLMEIERRRMGAYKKMLKLHPLHPYNEVLRQTSVRCSPTMYEDGGGLRLTFVRQKVIRDSFQAALIK